MDFHPRAAQLALLWSFWLSAGHQAQMLLMEVAQVASTLSNNNRHPILPQIFREAYYARDTEWSLLSPGL